MSEDEFLSSLYLDKVLDEYILFSPKTLHLIRLDAESYKLLEYIRKLGVEEGVNEFLKRHPDISFQDVNLLLRKGDV
ncbi:hypothetical protein TK1862 [Thermococcus kodakarensis KOD1]|uniref:Uncharacterized protein n=1 Tax=Thermococcus kodakarensis (strain ATCC BAA-918 / JCM 12380 / KOD1) TaxID=69014 RepID=Q5JEM1_THEKO|nr:hypothetical protein [Thermococcus kodakarensis]WCN27766.1 hypothetical protein POG15_09485 [Thermococcus kodakarensis]WCN30059.1 hypothetical protein POG21_09470 [Thermococcus kodakarensis]BAD86051.1 hypothetical protein TK1862 [Thermococcus kodakarensis KOD1]